MDLQCKHMLSPSRLWLKNNWDTCQKWWGKWEILSVVSATHSWTWHFLLRVELGYPHFIIDFPGLGCSFFPSIWSIPCHPDLWSYGSKIYQTPKSCHWYVQELSFCSYTNSWFSVSSLIIASLCLMSMMWIHHGPPLTQSLPVDFNSLSEKLVERLPSSTLELACPNGKLFTLDDRFTSLAFDRVISSVFEFSSFIQIPWIVLLVPWEPLSLLVVSLTLVNGPHNWPVIKRLSNMFNFNTSIHMLEFLLWLGHVGAQEPGLKLQKSRLQGDVTWWCWYTFLSHMDGWNHTMSCYMWSFSLLDACDHTLVSIWSSLLDGCAHALDPFTWSLSGCMHLYHDSCIIFQSFSNVYVSMLVCRFSDNGLQFPASTCNAFHPSL